jgi:hypothetical protein
MNVTRLIPVFSLTYIVAYQMFDYFNNPLIRYYPNLGRFSFGHIAAGKDTIGWYGWMAWALIVALVVTAIYAALPRTLTDRITWRWVWVVPICVAFFALYIVITGWWLS